MQFDGSRTRTKICGITNPDDAAIAVAAGADALGFVFHAPSRRYLSPEDAGDIIRSLPAFVTSVGVVVDLSPGELDNIAQRSGIDYFQFHGAESPEFCEAAGLPFLKAQRMKPGTDIAAAARGYNQARGILLDAYTEDLPGGTGNTFEWSGIPSVLPAPLFLAGGLTVDNVAQAILIVRPYAVDVSSGVERRPGIKDAGRLTDFLRSVREADRQTQQMRQDES